MSLKKNIAANSLSQVFVAGVGLLTVPVYAKYMGAEAYGLIGFYTMLQAWFQLLDIGLSPTLSRECALYKSGKVPTQTLAQLRKLLERFFIVVGIVGAALLWVFSKDMASDWLQVVNLSVSEVAYCVAIMGLVMAFRWISCLYRSVITGFEEQVWLSGINVLVAFLRFVLCIPVIIFIDASPVTYFLYQVAVSVFETILLWLKANRLVPKVENLTDKINWTLLKPVLIFAASTGLTSIIWVLVTQLDRLVLSKFLTLPVYGEFSVVVLLAGGINLLSGPISAALLPRLTSIAATSNPADFVELYKQYTRLVAVVIFPAALTLSLFAFEVLYAWTGNASLAKDMGSVLALYSMGNAVLAITAFAYYIQYAKGDLRLHVRGNLIFACLYLPVVVASGYWWGAIGTGTAWLGMNLAYLLFWVPQVHARLLESSHSLWLKNDVVKVLISAGAPAILGFLGKPTWERMEGGIFALVLGCLSFFAALLTIPKCRYRMQQSIGLLVPKQ